MNHVDVVLLNPPFYRFCGSHNNRVPLSLCYLSTYLLESGVSHVVYNADFTGAETYWSMKWMFHNFSCFKDAVDNNGSLFGEVIEIIMSFTPKSVVIMGGDPLFPTKDWGNPFIAGNFAKRLKTMGIHTIGIGPFFTLDGKRFRDIFDCIMAGEPNDQIVKVAGSRATGRIAHKPIGLRKVPNLKNLYPEGQQTDFVMTSFGCTHSCAFCLAGQQYRFLEQPIRRYVDLDTVVSDLKQREGDIYLTDLDFPAASRERMMKLAKLMRYHGIRKRFTIESRVDSLTGEIADLLLELGVKRVKLGIEGITEKLLRVFCKGTNIRQIERAVGLLKARGIAVVAYLVVGGVRENRDYERTRKYIKELAPEFVAVNVWAYDLATDYRYDTQFSPYSLARWGLTPEIFFEYLDLQEEINPTVGRILHSRNP